MEANEALRRIIIRHRLLLVVCLLAPVLLLVASHKKQAPKFAATARIQAQSVQPSSDSEADAILNRAKAVATSLEVVKPAVATAQLPRDPAEVAAHEISASRLSSSAIITLTVTEPTRAGAIAIADALAPIVVEKLNKLSLQQATPLVAQIDEQRQALTKDRAEVSAQLSKAPTAPGAPLLASEVQSIDNALATLLAQRQQLLVSSGSTGSAAVIDVPASAKGLSTGLTTRAILALVLGLVIGLLIANIDELLRPSISRPAAFGHELGVPLLGTMRSADLKLGELDPVLVPTLEAAAARAGVSTLVLTGPVDDQELFAVAEGLDEELALALPVGVRVTTGALRPAVNGLTLRVTERAPAVRGRGTDSDFAPRIQVVAFPAVRSHSRGEDFGLVALVPNFARYAAASKVADITAATGWPLLGVIGSKKRSRWRKVVGRATERR